MPNLKPSTITKLNEHLAKGSCDMATLASGIKDESENENKNIVKVITKDDIKSSPNFPRRLISKRSGIKIKNYFFIIILEFMVLTKMH